MKKSYIIISLQQTDISLLSCVEVQTFFVFFFLLLFVYSLLLAISSTILLIT